MFNWAKDHGQMTRSEKKTEGFVGDVDVALHKQAAPDIAILMGNILQSVTVRVLVSRNTQRIGLLLGIHR